MRHETHPNLESAANGGGPHCLADSTVTIRRPWRTLTLYRMRIPRIRILVLLALLVLVTGCIETALKVTNRTGGTILVHSGHTGQSFQIADRATVKVPHTMGPITISSEQGQTWGYTNICVPDLTNEVTKGFHRLTVSLSVEPTGEITLLSGRKIEPSEIRTSKK